MTPPRSRARAGVVVVDSPRGRGRQLNAGAAAATGDVLLFLHADVTLPERAAETVAHTLAAPGVVAGAFRTWTVSERRGRWWLSPIMHLADLRSRYTTLPYGDQALFVRAAAFRAAGGFPDVPLMEDVVLSRRLRELGRLRIARARVTVSGRRFEARPLRTAVYWNSFPLLHALGVRPSVLARLYGNPR
jgi:glycosyltransferase involved in cell wall biosynthesis